MRIGLHINSFTWPGGPQALRERLAEVARTADDAGFSFITVMDHFFQIGVVGPAEMEMLEGYSALAYLAGATKRVRLGTMVTGVTYRYPGVLDQDGHDTRCAFWRASVSWFGCSLVRTRACRAGRSLSTTQRAL